MSSCTGNINTLPGACQVHRENAQWAVFTTAINKCQNFRLYWPGCRSGSNATHRHKGCFSHPKDFDHKDFWRIFRPWKYSISWRCPWKCQLLLQLSGCREDWLCKSPKLLILTSAPGLEARLCESQWVGRCFSVLKTPLSPPPGRATPSGLLAHPPFLLHYMVLLTWCQFYSK